jgi:hypothetical protein
MELEKNLLYGFTKNGTRRNQFIWSTKMELEETLLYWFTKNGTRRNPLILVHKKLN